LNYFYHKSPLDNDLIFLNTKDSLLKQNGHANKKSGYAKIFSIIKIV
tara:strand:- start:3160 stop:3300 length:141 start_codon:yes stop_codon:yes gene_type:complete